MANTAYAKSLIASILQPSERPAWNQIMQYLLTTLTAGRAVPGATQVDRGGNLQWFPVQGTTASTPGDMFAIPHGIGRVPYTAYPVLPLDVEGAQFVPLTVAHAADAKQIYLSSTVADAPVYLMVEG